jgi:hypothetical protein
MKATDELRKEHEGISLMLHILEAVSQKIQQGAGYESLDVPDIYDLKRNRKLHSHMDESSAGRRLHSSRQKEWPNVR